MKFILSKNAKNLFILLFDSCCDTKQVSFYFLVSCIRSFIWNQCAHYWNILILVNSAWFHNFGLYLRINILFFNLLLIRDVSWFVLVTSNVDFWILDLWEKLLFVGHLPRSLDTGQQMNYRGLNTPWESLL